MVRTLSARKPEAAQPVWMTLPRLFTRAGSADLGDIGQLRVAIETHAVRRAAETANLDDLADLRSLVDGMRSAPNVTSFVELDTALHTRLVRIVGDDVATVQLAAILEARRKRFEAAFEPIEDATDIRRALADRLADAVDAIASRSGDRAAELIARHLENVDDVVGTGRLSPAG